MECCAGGARCAGSDDGRDDDKDALVPLEKHKCTDCLCLILLLACWICMSALGFVVLGFIDSPALPKGDPRRLVMDYIGQLCSVDDDYKVENDNLRKYDVSHREVAYFLPSGGIICIKHCPSEDDADHFLCEYDVQEEIDAYLRAGDGLSYYARGNEAVTEGRCNYEFATTRFLNYCVFDETPDLTRAARSSAVVEFLPTPRPTVAPTPRATAAPTRAPTALATARPTFAEPPPCTQALDDSYCESNLEYCPTLFCPTCALPGVCDFACAFCDTEAPTAALEQRDDDNDNQEVYERFAADFVVLWREVLFFGFGVATAFGLLYLLVLQIPYVLCLVIWVLLVALFAALLGTGILAAKTAREWQREEPRLHNPQEIKALKAAAALFVGGAVLYLCILCALRKRIQLAIAIIKEAAAALTAMPALLLTPLFRAAALLLFFAVWLVYATYLASSGEVDTRRVQWAGQTVYYKEFDYSRRQQYAALFLVFCFFWTAEFIAAMGQLLIAAAVVRWYFGGRDEDGRPTLCTPCDLLRLGWKVFGKHSGTAAFGGLVVGVVRTIRAVVAYVKRFTSARRSTLARVLLSCAECCLYCVEKCVRYINKMAYVQTAIHGVGLCAAGARAFQLIASNGARVLTVSVVSTFVLTLGKLCAAVATAFAFYLYIHDRHAEDLHSMLVPTLFVFLVAYLVADAFNDIFDMIITAVLQCFVVDEAQFSDDPYASGSLRAAIEATHKNRGEARAQSCCCCCCPADEDENLRAAFDEFDIDGSGQLEAPELVKLLEKSTGATPSKREVSKMMEAVDKDGSGAVSFQEFVAIHDKAKDGKVEFRDLSEAMLSLDSLHAELDNDDDGPPQYVTERRRR